MLDKILHTPWHLMRWVRLIVGLLALISFVYELQNNSSKTIDYLILGAGFYFIYKALFNTGCEVIQNEQVTNTSSENEIVDYTEIK